MSIEKAFPAHAADPAALARAAQELAEQGYPVFRLSPGKKIPIINTHGHKDATTDREIIARWWMDRPECNVGIVTGGAFWVLDIDVKPVADGLTGPAALAQLVAEHGPLPTTATVSTPSGGQHLYFRAPAERVVRCTTGLRIKDATGATVKTAIDVRGVGGYIVAVPSVIQAGEYRWTSRAPIADAPDWLLAMVTETAGPVRPDVPPAPYAGPSRYGDAVLRGAVRRIKQATEGGRHDALLHNARVVGGYIASGAIDEATATAALSSAGTAAGKPERETRRTIHDGIESGKQSPIARPPSNLSAIGEVALELYGELPEKGSELWRMAGRELRRREQQMEPSFTVIDRQTSAADDVPIIRISAALDQMIQEARTCLVGDERVYRRGGQLVGVIESRRSKARWSVSRGTAIIQQWPRVLIQAFLSSRARWLKFDGRSSEWVPAQPPTNVAEALVHVGASDDQPVLDMLLDAPTIRPDGSLLSAPGYDPDTASFLVAHELDVQLPALTQRHATLAAETLTELVTDFPFEHDSDRSAWLAALVAACARMVVRGPVPLTLITGNTPGTGKSMLVDLISTIAFGAPAPRMVTSPDDTETRKAITSVVLAGLRLVLLDNVSGAGGGLGGAAMDAMLTAEEWQDRVLGSNTTITLPMRTCWFATGNNVPIRGDLARRLLVVRLVTELEHPETRSDFTFPRLLATAKDRRSEYLTAALTVLAAYLRAGSPTQQLRPMGSFDSWSDTVRSAVVWTGLADPCPPPEEGGFEADPELEGVAGLLSAWHEVHGHREVTAHALCASDNELLREALAEFAGRGGTVNAKALGYLLRKYKNRCVDGYRLDRCGVTHQQMRWRVVKLASK